MATGAITARAEAQVLRFSGIYALLDCSDKIRVEHLRAALALWDYCAASVQLIFGESLGDPTADRILDAIKRSEAGLSETDLRDLFSRHKSAERSRAVAWLLRSGAIARGQLSNERQAENHLRRQDEGAKHMRHGTPKRQKGGLMSPISNLCRFSTKERDFSSFLFSLPLSPTLRHSNMSDGRVCQK